VEGRETAGPLAFFPYTDSSQIIELARFQVLGLSRGVLYINVAYPLPCRDSQKEVHLQYAHSGHIVGDKLYRVQVPCHNIYLPTVQSIRFLALKFGDCIWHMIVEIPPHILT
jgi:hypothetical protein